MSAPQLVHPPSSIKPRQPRQPKEIPASFLDTVVQEIITEIWNSNDRVQEDASESIADYGHRVGEATTSHLFSQSLMNPTQSPPLSPAQQHIDAVRFVCKDSWKATFGKPVDKLQSNGIDVYVIDDVKFLCLERLSNCCKLSNDHELPEVVINRVNLVRIFLAGFLTGSMKTLGWEVSVRFDLGVVIPSVRLMMNIISPVDSSI